MMVRKLLLLAGMALAAIAFSVPASASALEWTDEGGSYSGWVYDRLEGPISFGNPELGKSKFGCDTAIEVGVEGGSGSGFMGSLAPFTSTCLGEGAFTGCTLVEDSAFFGLSTVNILETNSVRIKGPITIDYVYDAECPIASSKLTVPNLTLTLTNSNFTEVTVSGVAEVHTVIKGLGESTQTVAVFGTVGTMTDTLSVS